MPCISCSLMTSGRNSLCKKCRGRFSKPIFEEIEIVEGEECRWIALTKGYRTLISAHRYDELMKHNWMCVGDRGKYAAMRSFRPDGKPFNLPMHVLINGTPDGMETDHKNRNGLDNRDSNLRTASRSENRANCGIYTRNKSGFKGVRRQKNFWEAKIRKDGVVTVLGRFKNIEDAANAYIEAAQKIHGNFSPDRINQTRLQLLDHRFQFPSVLP